MTGLVPQGGTGRAERWNAVGDGMHLPRSLLAAVILSSFLAGCADPDDGDDDGMDGMPMGPDSYDMHLSGVPTMPMSPGHKFNVTVQSTTDHQQMHGMMSDHIGAHMWNHTQSDPTAAFAASTGCVHTTGTVPGTFTAQCTAPMEAGVHYIRAHTRMMDNGTMHHYWSDEQTFTVAV